MRSTASGMPRSVSPTRLSSSYAGTTTATRLPSTIREVVLGGPAGVPAREHRVGQIGGKPTEDEPDQRADQRRLAAARRGHARSRCRLHDLALLHVDGERQELLVLEQLLLDSAAPLFREADGRVEGADRDQLVSGRDRLARAQVLQLLLVRGDARIDVLEL